MREIVLDTETTGLDPASGHRIVEIGCVEMVDRMRTGLHFQRYLNPERAMPEEARRIHGLDDTFLAGKPLFAEVVADFLDFIGESPLVIHNAGFDMKFLNAELARLGFPPLPVERAVDTVSIARKRFPGAPANLDALCRRFEIDGSARKLHGALLDATLLADVYIELSGGRQASILFDGTEITVGAEIGPGARQIPPRQFPVPQEELAAHAGFIEKLKNAIWKKLEA